MKKTPLLILLTLLLTSCGPILYYSSSTSLSEQTSPTSSPENSSSSFSKESNSTSSSSSSGSNSSYEDLPPISYVQVFCPVKYKYIYAWQDTNGVRELLGSWPGTLLKEYDSEWKTYDFPGETSLNLIFNLGPYQEQTADLYADEPGYYWYYDNGLHKSRPGEGDHEDIVVPEPVECDSWKDKFI